MRNVFFHVINKVLDQIFPDFVAATDKSTSGSSQQTAVPFQALFFTSVGSTRFGVLVVQSYDAIP
jgi:hypothetical protein